MIKLYVITSSSTYFTTNMKWTWMPSFRASYKMWFLDFLNVGGEVREIIFPTQITGQCECSLIGRGKQGQRDASHKNNFVEGCKWHIFKQWLFSESSGLFLFIVCWALEKAESHHGKLPSLSEAKSCLHSRHIIGAMWSKKQCEFYDGWLVHCTLLQLTSSLC